jgi:serine-type D-Ala-D-Ala carboxypeptidase/endopeptidase (penicillin-binding protein 4)
VELHQRLLLSRLLAATLWPCSVLLAGPVHAADFEQLARLAGQGARTTALVWDLDADTALAQQSAAERLIPASLSKIVIAAAALNAWPPDHNFATELRAAQAPSGGVLGGDLVLRGSGDATLDETTLWALAAQLRAQGITHIKGRVLVERAPFGELACDTVDRCRSLRSSARAYNAAPSAIGVNYGSWCIAVRAPAGAPTAAARAQVGGCATGTLPIPLTGSVQVAASGPALTIERSTEGGNDAIRVGGSITPGSERQVHRAMSDPAAGAGLILRSILLQTGVTVAGNVDTTVKSSQPAERVLAKVDGLLLQEQVGRMMRWSNNYIADVLTMNVALKQTSRAPASLAEASRALVTFVQAQGASNASAPATAGSPIMESGSGLTTSNRLSAQDLVDVLRGQYRDSRRFPAFYGGFVVPRDAAFQYLQSGGAAWQDRVALKTGTLTDPVAVYGIAGYLRKKNGGWMAFAVIVNGSERLKDIARDRALGAARTDLEALLARY